MFFSVLLQEDPHEVAFDASKDATDFPGVPDPVVKNLAVKNQSPPVYFVGVILVVALYLTIFVFRLFISVLEHEDPQISA